jgi:hypothetical protein
MKQKKNKMQNALHFKKINNFFKNKKSSGEGS